VKEGGGLPMKVLAKLTAVPHFTARVRYCLLDCGSHRVGKQGYWRTVNVQRADDPALVGDQLLQPQRSRFRKRDGVGLT
jgi:hypothetical protein